MTRDLKSRFDGLYRQYKEGLCDVAEIDHGNVKELLSEQAKTFFETLRIKVAQVRRQVQQKVSDSGALRQLEDLVETNKEYFGENAGSLLT